LFARLYTEQIHHRKRLNGIVSKALIEGVCYEKVEEGLYYYAATRFDENTLNELTTKCGHQALIGYVNFIDNTAYYPFSLSIENSEALYQFYKGRLNILVLRVSESDSSLLDWLDDIDTTSHVAAIAK